MEADTQALPVRCRACGGTASTLVHRELRDRLRDSPKKWNTVQCSTCGSLSTSPDPAISVAFDSYADYYTHAAQTPRPMMTAYARARFANGAWSFGAIAVALVPTLRGEGDLLAAHLQVQRGRPLLDVGAGSGHLVSSLITLGWDAVGLEPDAVAARAASNRGVPIRTGSLADEVLAGPFAAATLVHVIEHMDSPADELELLRTRLQPRGVVVVVTPNPASMSHRIFGDAWLQLDPPRHLCLFTQPALRQLLERCGFDVRRQTTSARAAGLSWRAARRYRRGVPFQMGAPTRLGERFGAHAYQTVAAAMSLVNRKLGEEHVIVAAKR